MANIVIYDPADPVVAGRVTKYVISAHTPNYNSEPNKLVNPNLAAVSGVTQKYWKHSTGSIVEMSQGEKDAWDASLPVHAPDQNVGVTDSPTTTSTSFVDMPDMLVTTASLSPLDYTIIFVTTFSISSPNNELTIELMVDGVSVASSVRTVAIPGANDKVN